MSFLPGAFPLAVSGGVILPVFIIAATSQGSSTVKLMADIRLGDLLVLFDHANSDNSGVPTLHTPTGWTPAASYSGAGDGRISSSYKIAAGNESEVSITGMANETYNAKVVFQFRSVRRISGVSIAGAVGEYTSSNPSAKTIAASGGTKPVLGLAAFSTIDHSSFSPRTTSITPNGETLAGSNNALYVQRYLQASAPANYTFDMDSESTRNGLLGFYFHAFN